MENLEQVLTLETLPKAFTLLSNEVSEIKKLLFENSNNPPTETERWFNLPDLCKYIPDKPAKPTVYGWITRNEIPYHKRAKKLYFLKSEIDAWLKDGKRKATDEIQAEADSFLQAKIKRS